MKKIIFVYNAESDIVSTGKDFIHKMLKPSTYGCNLCGLSYGNFGMKDEWKEFIESLKVPVEFTYKKEFHSEYKNKDTLPAAFLLTNGKVKKLISSAEINKCKTLQQLISLVKKKSAGL